MTSAEPFGLQRASNTWVMVVSSDCENFIVCALDQEIAGPVNLPRRLNSGFYYAHSDGQTIAAMEKVVRHAQTSSFYDMLCVEQEDPTVSMIIDVLNPNQT
ncbi:hypothetical protein HN51_034917 [Arachis hypogaea]